MAAAVKWNLKPDNTIVVLDGGSSEDQLLGVLDILCGWSFYSDRILKDDEQVVFREPDLDDEATGFALKPGYWHSYLNDLPLLFGKGVNEND